MVDFQHAHDDDAAATTTAGGGVDAAAAAAAAASHHHRRRALPIKMPRVQFSLVCALLRRDILHIVSLRLSSV